MPSPEGAPTRGWRRRLAPMVLIAGLALAAIPLLSTTPSERELVVRLDAPADALEVRWLHGDDLVWSASVYGGDPLEVRRTLRLPAGRYRVEARVTEGGTSREHQRHIDVAEDASQVLVPFGAL